MDQRPGERGARIEDVYREESPRLYRALVGFTGSREIADEAVAEAFARAIRSDPDIRDVRSWVWRVAFRVATGELLRHRDLEAAFDEELSEATGDVVDLVAALAVLPAHQRLSIVLHDYADRPTREIAALLGCSPATVHVHLSRARRRLRTLLEVSHA